MRLPLLIALAVAGPAFADTRAWTPGAFDRIQSAGPWEVSVVTGAAPSITATGDAEDLRRIRVDTVDGALRIRPERDGGWRWARRTPVAIRVVAPPLAAAALAGSGAMTIDRVTRNDFAGSVSGSGELALPVVAARSIALSVAGSGTLTAGGRVDSLSVTIAGSGAARLAGLRAQTLSGEIAGSGDLDAFATDTAALSVTGSGDAVVHGRPRCTITRAGSGSARCGD